MLTSISLTTCGRKFLSPDLKDKTFEEPNSDSLGYFARTWRLILSISSDMPIHISKFRRCSMNMGRSGMLSGLKLLSNW